MHFNSSLKIFTLGLVSLMLGILIYVFARDSNTSLLVMFLDRVGAHHLSEARFWLPGWLPSFIHVFAFSLITNALLATGEDFAGFSVALWVVINLIFEFAQWEALHSIWVRINGFIGTDMGRNWPIHGTFSVADLLGIIAGGVTAYMTIRALRGSIHSTVSE